MNQAIQSIAKSSKRECFNTFKRDCCNQAETRMQPFNKLIVEFHQYLVKLYYTCKTRSAYTTVRECNKNKNLKKYFWGFGPYYLIVFLFDKKKVSMRLTKSWTLTFAKWGKKEWTRFARLWRRSKKVDHKTLLLKASNLFLNTF